ncbi:MAG: multidrug efflux protein [Amycolatopsis sp.]|uniref:MFS transporter n=1 Tax=Amycolatopsis sp. TaxID=37632 RepID=UPI002619A096|nr:MFS transporter [Amycolatopsis sp.]MCU1682774.1 multidrug efflux protein [Amycolatopsis sp.]
MTTHPPATRTPETHRHAGRRAVLSPSSGLWVVTAAFTTLMAFGTVPTPLWPLYQVRDHFGPTSVTIAFAAMVAGAAVTFPTLGHLSDHIGRRKVVVPALVLGIVAAVVMSVWPSLAGLITGRFLTGVGVGLMAPTATAYIADLYRAAHPDRPGSADPGLISTAANLGGLALGPLVAGALAEWVPFPLATSYVVIAVIMGIAGLLVMLSPETVTSHATKETRPVRFALRPGNRATFGAAAVVGFFAFALMGLFSSLGAIIVRGELDIASQFTIGLIPFTAFAASAVAQLVLGRLPLPKQLVTGTVLFPVGLALTALSLYQPALWLALVAAGLSGSGAGLLFKGSVTQSAIAAVPASRAGVLAVFFVIAYLGMGLPSVAFSLLIQHIPLKATMIGFAAVLSVGTLVAVITAVRTNRKP